MTLVDWHPEELLDKHYAAGLRATLIARRVLARMQTRSAASHNRARRGARSSRRLQHRDDERD